MDHKIIRKFKLIGAWNDDKEEAWLSGMARQGLHLHSLGLPGIYNFIAGEPREDIYRMDFITNRKDYQHYLQLFQDAGWEHLGEMGGWQYFRTQKQGNQVPEIYTDNASKAQKYTRLLTFLLVFLPIYLMLVTRTVQGEGTFSEFLAALKFLLSLFLIFYAYAILRISRRIMQLKKK
jgi:hypothetical protein